MPPLSNHHLLSVNMEWMFWISVAVNLALPIAVFFARNWLKANASERRNGSAFGRHQATHGQSWPVLLSQLAPVSLP